MKDLYTELGSVSTDLFVSKVTEPVRQEAVGAAQDFVQRELPAMVGRMLETLISKRSADELLRDGIERAIAAEVKHQRASR